MDIVVWSKPNCVYCNMAKQELTKRKLPFTEKVIGVSVNKDELLELVPNARTVPQIIIDGKPIGGYDNLMAHFNKEN